MEDIEAIFLAFYLGWFVLLNFVFFWLGKVRLRYCVYSLWLELSYFNTLFSKKKRKN